MIKNMSSLNKKNTGFTYTVKEILQKIKDSRYSYMFILPGMVFLFVFCYGPMYGVILAFKEYYVNKGIWNSPWVGLSNFRELLIEPAFWNAFFNTIKISSVNIVLGFFSPLILAMLFNELKINPFKKTLQTIYTFPNFLSWIVVSGILVNLLSSNGLINQIIMLLGFEAKTFLADEYLIRPIIYISNVWKNVGWSSIIYLAAIAGISPEYYEAGIIDGANRFQRMIYITWPSIKSTAMILLILAVGGVMNAGFDQIFNLSNPVVQKATEIIDTYVYRITFNSGMVDYGFSTAVGLFKSVINFALVLAANKVVEWLGEGGLF